jgi:hypothetical protein
VQLPAAEQAVDEVPERARQASTSLAEQVGST